MFRVGLSQTLDLNASLNGGAADTGVTYEATPGSAAVLTVNSSTGVVTPVAAGAGVVLVKENGVTIDEVFVEVLADAEMTARDEIEAGTKRVVVSGVAGVPGVSHNFTVNGGAKISTAQQKFGTGSLRLQGSGDYLFPTTANSNFLFGTGDFTVEMWVYLTATASWSQPFLTGGSNDGGTNFWTSIHIDGSSFSTGYNNSVVVPYRAPSSGNFFNIWRHVVVSRQSGAWRIFIDGQFSNDAVFNNAYLSANQPIVGANPSATGDHRFIGYMNGLRVTKGVARYTDTFTPQATALSLTGDPHADKVVLLANFNGENNQTNISYTAFQ